MSFSKSFFAFGPGAEVVLVFFLHVSMKYGIIKIIWNDILVFFDMDLF